MLDYSENFDLCSLEELEKATSARRKDLKLILDQNQAENLIPLLFDAYDLLEIDGRTLFQYQTQYFDDDHFSFYYHHLQERPKRFKVRKRLYSDSNIAYLEIKEKFKGQTFKHRLKTIDKINVLSNDELEWMKGLFPQASSFKPTLYNEFERITLLSKDRKSKITLDQNIHLYFERENIALKCFVLEIKYTHLNDILIIKNILRALNLHANKMSKYALGMNMLNNSLKTGIFTASKRKILKING